MDVTANFGGKWHAFFEQLGVHDGLNPNKDGHIWLLHFLFLHLINEDASQWVSTWNNHAMRVATPTGSTTRTPAALYTQGIIQHGQRSIATQEDPAYLEDPDNYGVDWQDIPAHQAADAFVVEAPPHLAYVEVVDPQCPFQYEDQIRNLEQRISTVPECSGRNIASLCLHWIYGLDIAKDILSNYNVAGQL